MAIVSGRRERAEEMAKQFEIRHAFTDYQQVLALNEVDAVSIVTPPNLHHRMALDAFAASKHVLCEKPMAMNVRESTEMVAAWRKAKTVGMMDHEFRFVPARHYMKALIDQGYVGRPLYGNFQTFRHNYATPESRPWGWLFQSETGGGFLGALGSHTIDSVRYWCGEIESVIGFTETTVKERPDPATGAMKTVTADDAFGMYLQVEGGSRAEIVAYMTVGAGTGNRYELYGSEGVLIVDNATKLWGTQAGAAPQELSIPAEYFRADLGNEPNWIPEFLPFLKLIERFVEATKTGVSQSPTFEDGAHVQEVIDALRISVQKRSWIDLPLR